MLRKQRLRGRAAGAAEKTSLIFFTVVGVMALAIAVGVALPAEAKKRQSSQKPAEEPIADPANGEPMTLVVSLGNQRVDIYRGTSLVTSSKVSTGMRGYATKAGVFSSRGHRFGTGLRCSTRARAGTAALPARCPSPRSENSCRG